MFGKSFAKDLRFQMPVLILLAPAMARTTA